MSFIEDTQPFTPERRKAQLRRTQGGYDPKAFNQAFEPVTSDTSGVSDALIQSMSKRSQGAADIAKAVAPALGVQPSFPDPAVHTRAAGIAVKAAQDLGIDFSRPLGGPASDEGRVPVDNAIPTRDDATLKPITADTKVEGQNITPDPAKEIAQTVAPNLGIDPSEFEFANPALPWGQESLGGAKGALGLVKLKQAMEKRGRWTRIGEGMKTGEGQPSAEDLARAAADTLLAIPVGLGETAVRALTPGAGGIPERAIEAAKQGDVEGMIGPSAETAQLLAGARIAGGPPEGAVTLGAGPGGVKPPKGYSLKNPPPKTAPLPDASALIRPESDWHARVADLDAHNAPDEQYRLIMSASSKEMRANGAPKTAPSWRDKIVGILNKAAEKAGATTTPVAETSAPAAPDFSGAARQYVAGEKPPPFQARTVEEDIARTGAQNVATRAADTTRAAAVLPPQMPAPRVTELENDLFATRSRDNMRKELMFRDLKGLQGKVSPEVDSAVYHAREAGLGTAPPPVAPGMIRYYHGTSAPDATGFTGKIFVTPHEDYARNYRGGPNNVLYTDIPKDEAIRLRLYDDINDYPINGSIPDGAARLRPLKSSILTSEQQAYNTQVIEPQWRANNQMRDELRQMGRQDLIDEAGSSDDPNHMHRMRIGKTAGLDQASGLEKTVGYGNKLSQTPSSVRSRTIFKMEDEAGNSKVITEYPGSDGVYVWENSKPTRVVGSFIRTKPESILPEKINEGRVTLPRPVPARVKEEGLTKAYIKPSRTVPESVREEKTVPPKMVNDRFRPGSEFVDMNNKRWFIKQATTQEIHDAGVRSPRHRVTDSQTGRFSLEFGEPIRYHESALASVLTDKLALARALDNAKLMQKWQDTPEFKRYSVADADATPEQRREWQPIKAPGWQGGLYEPRFAEPIIDHLEGQGYKIPIVDPASNFATSWLFKTGIGSIAHGWNEHFQRMVARGVEGNVNVVRRAKTALQALDETMNKGSIWQDYRKRGAAFPSDSIHWRTVQEEILKTVGHKLNQEPGFKATMRRWGLTNSEGTNIVEHALGKATFEYGDFIALQHGLELEARGFTRQQAIDRMNRVLPTYRIPSRIISKSKTGRALARTAASPGWMQFGRYTYSRFKALSSIVEDIAGKGKTWTDRRDGLSRLITIVAIMAFVRPFVDKKLQEMTGDKNTHFLWGGPLGMVARATRMAEDVIAGRKSAVDGVLDALTSSVNLGPFIKEAIQQYTGRDLYNDKQFVGETDSSIMNLLERMVHAGGTFFQPTQAVTDPGRYFVEDPLRLSTSRPYNPGPHSARQARQQQMEQARRFQKLPGPVQSLVGGARSLYRGTQ